MLRAYWHAGVLAVLCQALTCHAAPVLAELARWNVNPDHSTIEFRISHMLVSKTAGRFMDYSGLIDMDAEAGIVKAIEATIKTASVNTVHE